MNKHKSTSIISLLKQAYPDAKCTLDFKSPIQLAVATILSAQSTDERVNLTTPALFKKYKSAKDFAEADNRELEEIIKPVGLFRNKAKNIIALAKTLIEDYDSKLPTDLHTLEKLPGIGRKTANVVQGVLLNRGEGIAVDTHVTRLSFRLGYTKNDDPKKIEADLKKLVPQSDWVDISHLLIRHGRTICSARKPLCDECFLDKLCPKNGVLP